MEIDVFCSRPFDRVKVTCEGNISMCCYQRSDPLIKSDPYIGNIFENSFDEIWFGDIAEEIREFTLRGDLHPKCQCPGCPFLHQNKPYQTSKIGYSEYPTFLEIDLPNTHCNVGLEKPSPSHPACVMCERASPLFIPENDRLKEVIAKISHLMPNIDNIHIQGVAEPFFKNLFFEVLDLLDFDKYSEKCFVSLTTNGTLFNKQTRSEYLRRCPKSVSTFSIDASTAETYKKIRILPLFDKVLENLYDYSKERDKKNQFLRISNNINILNVDEVVGMVHIAAKANVNILEFNATDGFNYNILVNETNCGKFYKAHQLVIAECKKWNVPYTFIKPLDVGLTDRLVQITL